MSNADLQVRCVNLLHKLHILGHLFSIKTGAEAHIACDNVVPHPLSKSAQSPNEIKLNKIIYLIWLEC